MTSGDRVSLASSYRDATRVEPRRLSITLVVSGAVVIVIESLIAAHPSLTPWRWSGSYLTGFGDLHARLHDVPPAGHDIYTPFGVYAFT